MSAKTGSAVRDSGANSADLRRSSPASENAASRDPLSADIDSAPLKPVLHAECPSSCSSKRTYTLPDRLKSIQWVPINVPLARRLQTFCVLLVLWAYPLLLSLLFISFFYTPLLYLLIPYLTFVYFFDQRPYKGGCRIQFIRKIPVFKHFCNYFPLTLETEAPPEAYTQNGCATLFASHPHGVLSLSLLGAFATEGVGWSKLFPDLNLRFCTLNMNFRVPFVRELMLAMGFISASRESIEYVLNKGANHAVNIVVGGGAEALLDGVSSDSHPIILKKRKGFIRCALRCGANLVPVYSFGENELYSVRTPGEDTFLGRFFKVVRQWTGMSVPQIFGRGVFQYSYGLVPQRRKCGIVLGKPIYVEKKEEVTEEMVDELHARYMQELTELFERHKCRFGMQSKVLDIIQ